MKNLLKLIGIALLTFTFAFSGGNKKTIVIDISHGGEDHGATFENYNEKEIVFNIANKMIELNQNSNIKIILTRVSDDFLSLEERAKMINDLKPEFVISLHANLHQDIERNGTEIYISGKNKEVQKSKELAQNISESFDGQKTVIKNANFLLLRNVEYPIALVELGFISNQKDREKLTSEDGQTEFANSILEAINRY